MENGPEMDDRLRDEIGNLRETAERTRCRFLQTELDACMTALEMANIGLRGGNSGLAEKEAAFVERAFHVVDRLLPDVPSAERVRFNGALAKLREMLKRLNETLGAQRRSMSKTA